MKLSAVSPNTPTLIQQTAAAYGVPPAIALAVATKESGLDQAAVGSSGEVGVFQLKPSTAADLNVDPYELAGNVTGGVKYLAQLFGQFGDWFTALTAYNGGVGNVQRGTVSSAAQNYALSVLKAAGTTSSAAASSISDVADSVSSFLTDPLQVESALPYVLGVAGLLLIAAWWHRSN